LAVFRLTRPESWVSGSTLGDRMMTPTPNWLSSWKTTWASRRMPTGGFAPFTELAAAVPTTSGLRWSATRCEYFLSDLKVRWRRQRTTRFSCTSVWERGALHQVRFTGGDFRSGKKLENVAIKTHCYFLCSRRPEAPRVSTIPKFKLGRVIGNQVRVTPNRLLRTFHIQSTCWIWNLYIVLVILGIF